MRKKMGILLLFILSFNFCLASVDVKFFLWFPTYDENQLAYYQKLGFNYCGIFVGDVTLFSHSNGKWVYNSGNYSSGQPYTDFKNRKATAEKYGFKIVPMLSSLSHTDGWISLDSTLPEAQRSISEFNAGNPKPAYNANHLTSGWDAAHISNYTAANHVAAAGNYGYNKGMDEIFGEWLKIIKSVYGSTSPEYIHIGHDEFGYSTVCFVKLGRTKNRTETRSQLVAMEINARVVGPGQINQTLGTSTKILIWGDCLLPYDNGETYGTCGDTTTGSGGTLQILDNTYGLKSRMTIMPWYYCTPEGCTGWPDFLRSSDSVAFPIYKEKQISFLNRLGYQYIACTGEDGSGNGVPHSDWAGPMMQSCFEWVRISQMYPNNLVGFGHCIWDPFGNSTGTGATKYYTGWTAPLLAYWGWTYSEKSLQMPRYNSYSSRMLKNVNYLKSRQDMATSGANACWIEGTHYFRPPLTGPLLFVPDVN